MDGIEWKPTMATGFVLRSFMTTTSFGAQVVRDRGSVGLVRSPKMLRRGRFGRHNGSEALATIARSAESLDDAVYEIGRNERALLMDV